MQSKRHYRQSKSAVRIKLYEKLFITYFALGLSAKQLKHIIPYLNLWINEKDTEMSWTVMQLQMLPSLH